MKLRNRPTARLRLAAAMLAVVALPLAGAGQAVVQAAMTTPSQRAAGGDFCTTDEGVTVVVDLSALGGSIVVRCVDGPLPSGYDGWDALADAGFNPQAPSRVPGFVCRIAGQPAASRSFDIPENSDYHEQCVNTPPTSAYWGYWYAKNGGSWTYSSSGAASHQVIDGGFEGWAFSLNSDGDPPVPGVEPSHSVVKPSPTSPTTQQPDPGGGGNGNGGGKGNGGGNAGGGGSPATTSPSTTSPSTTSAPPGQATSGSGGGKVDGRGDGKGPDDRGKKGDPTKTSDASAAGPTTAAANDDVLVTSELPDDQQADESDSGGSPMLTLVGVGVLVVLAVGAGVTAWRRSRRA